MMHQELEAKKDYIDQPLDLDLLTKLIFIIYTFIVLLAIIAYLYTTNEVERRCGDYMIIFVILLNINITNM
jgi:hypothetical protein